MADRWPQDDSSALRVRGSSRQHSRQPTERPAKSRSPKGVPEKLTGVARSVADQLLEIKGSMDRVMGTLKRKFMAPDDENPKTVRDWNRVRKSFNEVIAEARSQAKSGVVLLDDFLGALLPYLLSTEESLDFKSEEINIYSEKLLRSPENRSEKIKASLLEVNRNIDDFRRFWGRDPSTEYAREVEPGVKIVVNSIANLFENDSTASEDIVQNLDYSFPGVMKSSVILLPPDLAKKLYYAFDGEHNARFEIAGASKRNLLDHLINVERMLLADVQAFPRVFSDHVNRRDERGCMSKLELIKDLYGFLREALRGFGETISKIDTTKQTAGQNSTPAPPPRASTRPDRERQQASSATQSPPPPPPPPPPRSGNPSNPSPVKKTSFLGGIFGKLFGGGKKKR